MTLLVTQMSGMLSGCDSSTDPNPPIQDQQIILVQHKDDSARIDLNTLLFFEIDGERAVRLSELIDTNLVPPFRDKQGDAWESRRLYAYHIIADDGFSASGSRGYPNNVWEHMLLGHIMIRTRQVVFPKDNIDLAGAYNVKGAARILLKRKIDLVLPDSTTFVELAGIIPHSVTNPNGDSELAIPFESIVRSIIPTPEAFTYTIKALDGAGPDTAIPWNQFQSGYWLINSERSMFTDPALSTGMYRLSALEQIIANR